MTTSGSFPLHSHIDHDDALVHIIASGQAVPGADTWSRTVVDETSNLGVELGHGWARGAGVERVFEEVSGP